MARDRQAEGNGPREPDGRSCGHLQQKARYRCSEIPELANRHSGGVTRNDGSPDRGEGPETQAIPINVEHGSLPLRYAAASN